MSGEPYICVIGNVAGEPQLRFAPSGVPVLNFTVASTPRNKDKATGEWVDGTTMWVRVTAFRTDAENTAESIVKGSRVIAWGRLQQEEYDDKEGNKRTSLKLLADEIGLSTKWAQVSAVKTGGGGAAPARKQPANDPWAAAPEDDDSIPF